jgi:hypothetical protein
MSFQISQAIHLIVENFGYLLRQFFEDDKMEHLSKILWPVSLGTNLASPVKTNIKCIKYVRS